MASRSEKMYKDSPKIERGEDGNMAVSKKKAAEVGAGVGAGVEKHVQDMEHKHAKERMELYHKHEKEHLEMMQKHRMSSGKEVETGGEDMAKKKSDTDKGAKKEDLKEGAMGEKK